MIQIQENGNDLWKAVRRFLYLTSAVDDEQGCSSAKATPKTNEGSGRSPREDPVASVDGDMDADHACLERKGGKRMTGWVGRDVFLNTDPIFIIFPFVEAIFRSFEYSKESTYGIIRVYSTTK